jgi:hypothetical protein
MSVNMSQMNTAQSSAATASSNSLGHGPGGFQGQSAPMFPPDMGGGQGGGQGGGMGGAGGSDSQTGNMLQDLMKLLQDIAGGGGGGGGDGGGGSSLAIGMAAALGRNGEIVRAGPCGGALFTAACEPISAAYHFPRAAGSGGQKKARAHNAHGLSLTSS